VDSENFSCLVEGASGSATTLAFLEGASGLDVAVGPMVGEFFAATFLSDFGGPLEIDCGP
jgi:hypothetical protein